MVAPLVESRAVSQLCSVLECAGLAQAALILPHWLQLSLCVRAATALLLQAVLNLDVMAAGLNPQISTLPR